jgi:monovalent cation/hydrogen antiporter
VTGLQLRALLDRTDVVSLRDLPLTILLVLAVIVAARFIWVFPAAYIPRWLSPALVRRDPTPPWQWLFLLGFVGVRGVVSLAAALALPLFTEAGAPFPGRDVILFVTFGIIVVTLVGQGLALPSVVRWLALPRDAEDERRHERDAEITARLESLHVAQNRLDRIAADGDVPAEVMDLLRARNHSRSRQLPKNAGDGFAAVAAAAERRIELIAAEREYIYRLLQDGKITDEARRRIERELDLEEASIACQKEGGVEPPL